MRYFFKVLRTYVSPYKKNFGWSVVLTILSAIFNIFSFALLIPILQILFGINQADYSFIPWDSDMSMKEIAMNNMYWYVKVEMIGSIGPSLTLLFLGLFMLGITLLKTSCYFGASAVMVPLRTGIIRDIRVKVYNKLMGLPLRFFSGQKKGDLIARMTGDVTEIEVSITSSLEMLVKNPILILFYFGTLVYTSWQLALFTICVVPLMAWIMGAIGKKLKARSLEAQSKWSEILAQFDETLGGLRVIKAFIAEDKMKDRFRNTADSYRQCVNKVQIRQASAHPVSEFLGTAMIMLVLWFGGTLILSNSSPIDAPTFIFFMVILYSVLQPLKDLSKAGYAIPKGIASIERVNTILDAVNDLTEVENPKSVDEFKDKIEIKGVCFSYDDSREVLTDIYLTVPKGKMIALVGQSGSGKSTLVDLIPRYYDVDKGSICIDGVDIRDMKIKNLRALIGNVNQEAILFNDTIFNNIAFGVENATMGQVIEAAKIANAHDFIMEKEEGYMTNIGDRGILISSSLMRQHQLSTLNLKNSFRKRLTGSLAHALPLPSPTVCRLSKTQMRSA